MQFPQHSESKSRLDPNLSFNKDPERGYNVRRKCLSLKHFTVPSRFHSFPKPRKSAWQWEEGVSSGSCWNPTFHCGLSSQTYLSRGTSCSLSSKDNICSIRYLNNIDLTSTLGKRKIILDNGNMLSLDKKGRVEYSYTVKFWTHVVT